MTLRAYVGGIKISPVEHKLGLQIDDDLFVKPDFHNYFLGFVAGGGKTAVFTIAGLSLICPLRTDVTLAGLSCGFGFSPILIVYKFTLLFWFCRRRRCNRSFIN
jgi:hypothetical protein